MPLYPPTCFYLPSHTSCLELEALACPILTWLLATRQKALPSAQEQPANGTVNATQEEQ
ncbi:unnamed protein product [Chrysoparadoxa australica]